MSTKTEPGAFDGMERAEPDEPVFTLRAHDDLAAGLVMEWVRMRRAAVMASNLPPEKEELELVQCREAEEVAWSMREWRAGASAKAEGSEDQPAAKYSGHTSSAEELAAKARYDVVKGSASKLHNCLSEAIDAADALEPYGYAAERAVVHRAADHIKAVAMHIQPKRASYSTVDPEPEPFEPGLLEISLQGYMK